MKKLLSAIINRMLSMIHCVFVSTISRFHLTFAFDSYVSTGAHFALRDNGRIKIGNKVAIRRYAIISASHNGFCVLGNRVFLNNNVHIACHEKITIGEGTRIGPGAKLFDHDYDYYNFSDGKHVTAPIDIGNNVWIGADVIVLRGTKIGDGCVIAAGSVIKGEIPAHSLIVQKRHSEILPITR